MTYEGVTIDMGDVVTALATPFKTVDPYLGPVRDVVDMLRTPLPVVSELSELGGGDEISLLSLLATLGGGDARVDLALRVISYASTTADLIAAIAAWAPRGRRRHRRSRTSPPPARWSPSTPPRPRSPRRARRR